MSTTIPKQYDTARRHRAQLTLLARVQDAHPDTYPRLGIPFEPYETDESPDEAASTRYFLERRRNPNAMPDLVGLDPIGANAYTPWDEYHGPGGSAA